MLGWLLLILLSPVVKAQSVTWTPLGASPNTGGQTENIVPNNEVVGAINALAAHPTNANILYAGAVNGGIWKSENAMAAAPAWKVLTDEHESLSIGAVEFDPTDSAHKTLVAGSGGNSSFGSSGARIGVLRTTDGITWTLLDGGGALKGLNISGVVPRGNIIVISAASSETSAKPGLWRTVNSGATWARLSGTAGTGLPPGHSFEVCGDPIQLNIMYAHTVTGLFKSLDLGATWSATGDPALTSLIATSVNMEISVGSQDNVFVATVGPSEQLSSVFRSGNGGMTWKSLGVPTTVEGGIHPGAQGSLHLSLTAEPSDVNVVYIGGDRQAANGFPNSIGAKDWSGRLFRGNAALEESQRWAHLTHSNTLGNPLGGTATSSAPHADSRAMVVAANGVLIEGDDGGVYRRTKPKDNTGDWFSANGDLQTSEYHAIAWDSNANVIVAGAQDTGSSEQILSANKPYRSISTADGGVVAVDDKTTAGRSVRYSSNQFLGSFRRHTFDAANTQLSSILIPLTPIGSASVSAQFYTPLALNSISPMRLIIGGANGVFESANRGDTVRLIGPGIVANESGQDCLAYGAADNADAIYVGSDNTVFVRDAAHPAALTASATYPGGTVMSVVMDPDHWKTAYVIDPSRVFTTADGGATWMDISGNLSLLKTRVLRCLAVVPGTPPVLIVGSDKGVYGCALNSTGVWSRLKTGLPNVPVYHLEYDSADKLLVAGTLGRGAWTIMPSDNQSVPELLAQALAQAAPPMTAVANIAAAANEPPSPPITLAEGILIEANKSTLLLMQPVNDDKRGGIESVDLKTGQSQWKTPDGEKPLDINQGRVIAQSAADAQNEFKLSVLDVRTGKEMVAQTQTLGASVKSSIDATNEGQFTVQARASGQNELITWRFQKRLLRGVKPGALPTVTAEDADVPIANSVPARVRVTSGTLQFNLGNGELQPLNVELPEAVGPMFAPNAVAEVDLPNVEGEQTVTADGAHVIASVLIGDDTVFEKYQLSIHDKATGEKRGAVNSHIALPKAFVTGDRLILVQDPHSKTTDGKLIEVPRTVKAFSLDGKEIWSREVRDTEFRGPYPP